MSFFENFDLWFSLSIKVIILVFILGNLRGVNKALKGGNGHWSMDEVSKAVIIGILLFMVGVDAGREHEWLFFPTWIYAIFITGLFFMAKMEKALEFAMKMIELIKSWKERK